jgi:hypothetical protein
MQTAIGNSRLSGYRTPFGAPVVPDVKITMNRVVAAQHRWIELYRPDGQSFGEVARAGAPAVDQEHWRPVADLGQLRLVRYVRHDQLRTATTDPVTRCSIALSPNAVNNG